MFSLLWTIPAKIWLTLTVWFDGFAAIIGIIVSVFHQSGSSWKARAIAAAGSPEGLRRGMAVLRAFQPNLVLKTVLLKQFENNGTAIITRNADVRDVLNRHETFVTVYGPRMEKLTNGQNFFLGMRSTPTRTRDVANMRLSIRREDIAEILIPKARAVSERIVTAAGGSIDLPPALSQHIPYRIVALRTISVSQVPVKR